MRGAYYASTSPSPRLASADMLQVPCCSLPGWGAYPTSSSNPTPKPASRTRSWLEFLHESRLAMKFLHAIGARKQSRSEEHTSELQSLTNLVCRLLLEKKKKRQRYNSDR